MRVREDIFPEADKTKVQDLLQGLTHVSFQSFGSLFPSKDELICYVNNFKNAKIARQFLEIGEFYHSAKFYYCPNCFPRKRIEICPYCKNSFEMPAYIVLIMIISILERLSLGIKKFTDFFGWVSKKNIVRQYQALLESGEIKGYEELINSLREHWLQEYGSVTKVAEFFDKFLNKEEKIEFIKSIRYPRKVPELPPSHIETTEGKTREEFERIFEKWEKRLGEEQQISFSTDEDVRNYVKNNNFKMTWEALPICFDQEHYWKCHNRDFYGHGLGYCRYHHCPLIEDGKMIEECFRKTVSFVYDWRSKFVHGERLPPILEISMVGDVYEKKQVIIELTTTKLKPLFEKMLKRYFDKYQKKD